jgi:hypothetical protein
VAHALSSRVSSPYTVHFFGACLHPKLCMVMELCSRGSLCDVLKAKDIKIGYSITTHIFCRGIRTQLFV